MKIKNKILPLISLSSITMFVIPTTLTSCSNQFSGFVNVLKKYETRINPVEKISFYDPLSAGLFYQHKILENPNIVRDDLIFSWSQALTNSSSRAIIDEYVNFTKYDLDISLEYKKEISCPFYLKIKANVAGTGKNIAIDSQETKMLKDFNLSFDVSIMGVSNWQYDNVVMSKDFAVLFENDLEENEQKEWTIIKNNVDESNNYYCMCLPFAIYGGRLSQKFDFASSTIMNISCSGSYSYSQNDTLFEINDYREISIIDRVGIDPTQPIYQNPYYFIDKFVNFSLLQSLIFSIPKAMFDTSSWELYNYGFILFSGAYLRNAEICKPL